MNTNMKLMMAFKIWIVIYPALTFVLYVFGEPLSVLPLYLRTLIMTAALVPFVLFAGVPLVNKLIGLISGKSGK